MRAAAADAMPDIDPRAAAPLLRPVDRAEQRRALGRASDLGASLPFVGEDVWNCYELSWLTPRGMPAAGALRIRLPSSSPATVESKSLKLYLNAFSQMAFRDEAAILATIDADLFALVGARPAVSAMSTVELGGAGLCAAPGRSLDRESVGIETYRRDAGLLDGACGPRVVEEELHTDLFASLCPITGWPDWASLLIAYRGPQIEHRRLLRYLVSYRRHRAFHETVIEQIFVDIKARCGCERLTVYGRFLRRGGIDINPFRSTHLPTAPPIRLARQ